MVGKIIRDYMEGGARKLTVPGFGTFMRRDGGEVIFVDLLRGDDRVLAEMVERAGPFTEVEAMARIDRFVFETRNAIERTGRATIAGFGSMTADGKGVYRFDYSPDASPAPEGVAAERPSDAPAATAPKSTAPPAQAPPPTAPPTAVPRATAPQATASQSRPQGAAPRRVPSDAQRGNSADAPRRSPANAPRRRPADAPHGKGAAPERRRPNDAARRASTTDRLLIFAIIAAAIALAAMIFGLTSSASHIPFVNN